MTPERWIPVDGFPLYEVSDFGRVRSLPRTYFRRHHKTGAIYSVTTKPKLICGWRKYRGESLMAVMISLRRDNTTVTDRIHRLVLTTFVGPAPPHTEGCHNDGDPTNNRLGNLRWDTHASNVADSIRHGTKTDPPVHVGESHFASKLTDEQVREILRAPECRGVKAALSRRFGISQTSIGRIRAGAQRVLCDASSHSGSPEAPRR